MGQRRCSAPRVTTTAAGPTVLLSKKEHRNWVPFSPGQAKNELSDLVKLKSTESTERVKGGMNVVQLMFPNFTTKLGEVHKRVQTRPDS